MKRIFLAALAVFVFLLASAQDNGYIVKTRSATKKAQVAAESNDDQTAESSQEKSHDFISENFRYQSLCDWQEGMKFMVMPEKYDMVVKTFTDAATGKIVSSMPLKYKIMIYQGHTESADGHSRINFHCQDNNHDYYYEIPSGSFEDYCYGKTGVPTLAYLGDVDMAKDKLIGKVLYTKATLYRIDTEYDGDGYQEITVEKDIPVTVTQVGVGTRSFPVKIIVEDKAGNEFYQNVAISKTNSGMRDDEFIMDNTKYLFAGSFELQDDINGINSFNYKNQTGKIIHTKYPISMLNETTKKWQNIPRMVEYEIESITPHKNDDYFTFKLKNTILGTYFYKDMALDSHHAEDQSEYFGNLFGLGPGKKFQTSETSRAMIRAGHVSVGFTEDETQLAAGEADRVEYGENGAYTWIYNRSNNKLLYVDFNGSGEVTKTYVKNAPKQGISSVSARRIASQQNSGSWQTRSGTPLK